MSDTRVAEPTRTMPGVATPTTGQALARFDPDAWHVQQERDATLIEQEILNGAGSNKFVYSFSGDDGTTVSGVSVIGARHLASKWGGLSHRMIGSLTKVGRLLTAQTFPQENIPMQLFTQILPELEHEPDFYTVIIEVYDLKSGNRIQVEATENRKGLKRDKKTEYVRPHYKVIAQSKAYRNGVLHLLPQDFTIQWKEEMIRLGKGDVITADIMGEKRDKVMQYAAKLGIPIDRKALETLLLPQIGGLAEAAAEDRVDGFRRSAEALAIVVIQPGGEISQMHRQATAPKPAPAKGFRKPDERPPSVKSTEKVEEEQRAAETAKPVVTKEQPKETPADPPAEEKQVDPPISNDEQNQTDDDGIHLLSEDGEDMGSYMTAYDWASAFVRHAEGLPDAAATQAYLEHNAGAMELAHEDPLTSKLLAEAGYPTGPQTGAIYPPRTRSGAIDEEPYIEAVKRGLATLMNAEQLAEWVTNNAEIQKVVGRTIELKVGREVSGRKRMLNLTQNRD